MGTGKALAISIVGLHFVLCDSFFVLYVLFIYCYFF